MKPKFADNNFVFRPSPGWTALWHPEMGGSGRWTLHVSFTNISLKFYQQFTLVIQTIYVSFTNYSRKFYKHVKHCKTVPQQCIFPFNLFTSSIFRLLHLIGSSAFLTAVLGCFGCKKLYNSKHFGD